MNTDNSTSDHPFCDRALISDDLVRTKDFSTIYQSGFDARTDRVSEFLNTMLQMLLVACLLVSLAICGWSVSGGSDISSTPVAVAKTKQVTTASAKVVQSGATATPRYRMQVPSASYTLKLSPKFF